MPDPGGAPVIAGLLALCVLGAPGPSIAIHIEEAGEMAVVEARAIARELAEAISAHTKARASVDPAEGACAAAAGCAGGVVRRLGSPEVVWLRLYAGVLNVRVLAERVVLLDGGEVSRTRGSAQSDLPRDPAARRSAITAFAGLLYPEGALAAGDAGRLAWAPWLAMGGAVVAAGVGVGLGVSSDSVRTEIESRTHTGADLEDLGGSMRGRAIAANTLFVVAGAGAAVALAVWLWPAAGEEP